jgi:pterin-4a-carbinolamine dehydratase
MQPSIFVSYRREDSEAEAGRLRTTLLGQFGDEAVFMDTSSIQAGAEWPSSISSALDCARVVLVILGPEWVRVSDEWGQRRIDEENDWVRREIEQALALNKEVIPVLVRGARIPPAEKLPRSISALPNRQKIEIRTTYWDHDMKLLQSRLESLAKTPLAQESAGIYPIPPPYKPDPISDEALKIALEGSLLQWRTVDTPVNGLPDTAGTELFREYKFRTFRDAIRFMNEVAPGCDIAIHHPRWENIWKTLKVYLTTWDIGNRISDRDIQLARYFDKAYSEFVGESAKD